MEIKKGKGVRWIDVERPADKEINQLGKEFGLHPVIVGELKGPSARAHVEAYKDYLFFVYYFPLYDKKDELSVRTEIDFIVTKDTVITVHYESIREVMNGFDPSEYDSSLTLLYRIIENLVSFQERQLRHIREKVEALGHEIFKNHERETLQHITYLKRDVSEYRIIVRSQEPVFRSLFVKGKKLWGTGAEVYLNDLMGDQLKVVNQIDDYREAIADFEDTNVQLMNLKINTVMRTLTSLSFLTFPFMLVAAVFSMRTEDTPLVGTPGGFWIIVGIIIAGMALMAVYFKKKDWF